MDKYEELIAVFSETLEQSRDYHIAYMYQVGYVSVLGLYERDSTQNNSMKIDEVFHSPEEMAWYAEVAAQHGLFCTCGSDFHGEIIKPDIALGTGRNNRLCLPDELECQILERFQAALSK